jgi:putative membrane protein
MIIYNPRSLKDVLLRFRGTVLPGIWMRCLLVFLIGLFIMLLKLFTGVSISFSGDGHTIVSLVLSLLLAFRTQVCNERYSEGHKLLDTCSGALLSLVRVVCTHVGGNDDLAREFRGDIRRLAVCQFLAIKQHIRKEYMPEEYGVLLGEREMAALSRGKDRPQVVAVWISVMLERCEQAGRLGSHFARHAEVLLHAVTDSWGGMLRISGMRLVSHLSFISVSQTRRTGSPIPLAYAAHIKFFVLAYVFTVPFVLLPTTGLLTPFAALLVAYAMFGVEEIGLEIEEPFGRDANDLPLDTMAAELSDQCVETHEAVVEARSWLKPPAVAVASPLAARATLADADSPVASPSTPTALMQAAVIKDGDIRS